MSGGGEEGRRRGGHKLYAAAAATSDACVMGSRRLGNVEHSFQVNPLSASCSYIVCDAKIGGYIDTIDSHNGVSP
jgi:hypothetical protein